MRKALARRPTIGRVVAGRDAYVPRAVLRAYVEGGKCPRHWSFHEAPTTVQLPPLPFARRGDDTYAKLLDRFTSHKDSVAAMRELLRECESYGVPRPGGYADVFHEHFYSPRVPYSINVTLAPLLAGGWQSAISPGVHEGVFHKYDLRSAYLWAGSLALPDPETYRRSTVFSPDQNGIYAIELERPNPLAPFPFNRARRCLATAHEIELYSLTVKRVISGVRWTRWLDPRKMLDAVRMVSFWKEAGRSYWGRWGQRERVECHVQGGKSWPLPNVAENLPWAHLIVSRVRERVWNYSTGAVHVYVDSIITREQLPTGADIGDWKLEKTYPDGVVIRAPGQYGDARFEQLERMAGVPANSPRRRISKNMADISRNVREALAAENADLLAG